MKVFLVEKFSDLNSIGEKAIAVDEGELVVLANSDIVFDAGRHYHIKKKAYGANGSLVLFVEKDNGYPIDDKFIEYYFSNRNN